MKRATELGEVSVNKPAWRLMIDAVISIINSIRESNVNMLIKGITTVCFVAIVSFAIVKLAITVTLGKGAGVVIFIAIIASAVILGIIWLHDQ